MCRRPPPLELSSTNETRRRAPPESSLFTAISNWYRTPQRTGLFTVTHHHHQWHHHRALVSCPEHILSPFRRKLCDVGRNQHCRHSCLLCAFIPLQFSQCLHIAGKAPPGSAKTRAPTSFQADCSDEVPHDDSRLFSRRNFNSSRGLHSHLDIRYFPSLNAA